MIAPLHAMATVGSATNAIAGGSRSEATFGAVALTVDKRVCEWAIQRHACERNPCAKCEERNRLAGERKCAETPTHSQHDEAHCREPSGTRHEQGSESACPQHPPQHLERTSQSAIVYRCDHWSDGQRCHSPRDTGDPQRDEWNAINVGRVRANSVAGTSLQRATSFDDGTVSEPS